MSAKSKLSPGEPLGSAAISRRAFARNLAVTALAAGAASGTAAEMATADDKGQKPTPPAGDEASEGTPAAQAELAPEEHLLAVIQQLYPHEALTEERLEAIKAQLGWYVRRSQILSSFPLTNGDEPATAFAAYRSADD